MSKEETKETETTETETQEIDMDALITEKVTEGIKSALESEEFKTALIEHSKSAIKDSFGKTIKIPQTKNEGLTRESIKNMSQSEINERWDEVTKVLATT